MDDLTPQMFIAPREHPSRWGTANLVAKAIVILQVEGHSANPIHISLTRQLVLGRVEGTHQESCLNLAAARLRYIAGSAWSTKRYMSMRPLYQPQVMQTGAVA